MRTQERLPRRRFLQVAAATGTAAATVGCGTDVSPWRTLTRAEGDTLAALCDQIIPPDQDAGASEAGVVDFLDRQLSGRYKRHRRLYREGIEAVNRIAGGSFARLEPARQLELIQRVEAGKESKESAAFFALLVTHTMQGYYGMPRHGGNRNYASWRMIGVPVRPLRGRRPENEVRG